MEGLKHTPGPWEIEYDNSDSGQWFSVGPAKIEFGWATNEREEEAEANAKLIAAAPTMLSLLLKLKDKIENHDEWWMSSPNKGGFDVDEIELIIKKSTE